MSDCSVPSRLTVLWLSVLRLASRRGVGEVLVSPLVDEDPPAAGRPFAGEEIAVAVPRQVGTAPARRSRRPALVLALEAEIAPVRQRERARGRGGAGAGEPGPGLEQVPRQQRHRQAAVVELGDPAVGVGEQAQGMDHPGQGGVELGKGVGQGGAAGEQIEHLALVGRRALVMAAVGQHLLGELAPQQAAAEGRPALGLRAGEERPGPEQGADVLDQVVAAQIGLEMPLEEAQLLGQRGLRPAEEGGSSRSWRRQLLHPDRPPRKDRL